ncbi:hypothetical protein EAG_05186 [Camponotus floridanus]|uniref:Uncharacterized protein n=1 Tax=Camponotus floridanus TaxID=104421 RepID=E2AQF6_CAMFO|nr:hypothetical protein EAG_05186 [Camponotus floridanus]
MIKRHSSKQSMEECQNVDKIINDVAKASHSAESPNVKPNDDGVTINKSDKQSIDPQPISYQGNTLPESSFATDRSQQGRGSKRKLDDLEDRSTTTELDLGISSQWNQWRMTEGIKPRIKDAPMIFTPEKNARNRIRNGRMMEGRPFSRRHVSSPKYASFLRMFHKEEVDELRSNSSPRKDDGEKLQRRRGLSTQSTRSNESDQTNPQIERRMPTPRSTVHTTYNPIMHSSATDPILDSSGLTIQLLRLAVLLYAPALMPALNSLIAQQNQQTPVSSSSFERSNDLLTQIFRLLHEQQSISNLPFVSLGSERGSPTLAAETNTESSQTHSKQKDKNISITTEKSPFSLKEESTSAGISRWNSNNHVQQQKERARERRLTSMLTDSDVRLNRNIFAMEDLRKFEEFLRTGKKRSEDVRSLSTRNKNEIVMKEYFRNWLHRLLQQLNSSSNNLSVNDQKAKYSEGSSNTGESSLEEIEGQGNTNRLIVEESSKDEGNIFTEYEEEDSDEQKSFTSATSTNSSRSLQLKQNDVRKAESRNENPQD